MNIEFTFDSVNRRLKTLSPIAIFGIALAGVAAVGVPDYLIGFEISLSFFYLFPVGFSSWYGGRTAGTLIAFISTVTSLSEGLGKVFFDIRPGVLAWNGLLHFGFMMVVVLLLDRLRARVEIERELARSDSVTGIFNRRAFFEKLQYLLALAARERKPIVLAYIDLDDFKRINDEHGHDEGDRVLQRVANTLKQSTRRTDVVARLGGDEFVVLMPGVEADAAENLVTKIQLALSYTLAGGDCAVTCSIGCVVFQTPPVDSNAAIKAADALMYRVKSRGKNAVAFEIVRSPPTASPGRQRA